VNTVTRLNDIPPADTTALPAWEYEVRRIFYEAGRAGMRAELAVAGT
jgi:hypothetical protein